MKPFITFALIFFVAMVAYSMPIEDIRRMAEAGDRDAQFALGTHYEAGLDVARDSNLAKLWYKKAAIQGHHGAWLKLGDRTIREPFGGISSGSVYDGIVRDGIVRPKR